MTVRPFTLLVVDDDPAITRLMEAKLAKSIDAGLATEFINDSTVAAERLEQGTVDILITDLEMPQIDGIELTKIAKRRNAWTQIILLTGHSSHEALLEAMEAGASDYLLKSCSNEQMLSLIDEAKSRLTRWQTALVGTWRQKHSLSAAGQ